MHRDGTFLDGFVRFCAQDFPLRLPTWLEEGDVDGGAEHVSLLVLEDDDGDLLQIGNRVYVSLTQEEVLVVHFVCLPQGVALRAKQDSATKGGSAP